MMLSSGLFTLVLALLSAQGHHAAAKRKKAPDRAPAAAHRTAPAPRAETSHPDAPAGGAAAEERSDRVPAASAEAEGGASTTATVKPAKTKVYTFGAMDVEGKLKTPQLLYFLNRVKLELEMSAPDQRSFMKELERTAEDPNL